MHHELLAVFLSLNERITPAQWRVQMVEPHRHGHWDCHRKIPIVIEFHDLYPFECGNLVSALQLSAQARCRYSTLIRRANHSIAVAASANSTPCVNNRTAKLVPPNTSSALNKLSSFMLVHLSFPLPAVNGNEHASPNRPTGEAVNDLSPRVTGRRKKVRRKRRDELSARAEMVARTTNKKPGMGLICCDLEKQQMG
jgi:hypothetical protein